MFRSDADRRRVYRTVQTKACRERETAAAALELTKDALTFRDLLDWKLKELKTQATEAAERIGFEPGPGLAQAVDKEYRRCYSGAPSQRLSVLEAVGVALDPLAALDEVGDVYGWLTAVDRYERTLRTDAALGWRGARGSRAARAGAGLGTIK